PVVLDLLEGVEAGSAGGLHRIRHEDDIVDDAEAVWVGEIERRNSGWPDRHDEPPLQALSVPGRPPLAALYESRPVTSPQLYRVDAEMSRGFFLQRPCSLFITMSLAGAVHGPRIEQECYPLWWRCGCGKNLGKPIRSRSAGAPFTPPQPV